METPTKLVIKLTEWHMRRREAIAAIETLKIKSANGIEGADNAIDMLNILIKDYDKKIEATRNAIALL